MVELSEFDDYVRHAEWIKLLLERPFDNSVEWARTVLLRILETHAECRYRYDDARLKGKQFSQDAKDALVELYDYLEPADQRLYLRVIFIVPWDTVRRKIGLGLRANDVVKHLAENTDRDHCISAAKDIVKTGLGAVNRRSEESVLVMARQPGQGIRVELSRENARRLGTSSRIFEFDRVELAIRTFNPYSWESNLRAIVSWWLESQDPDEQDSSVDFLLRHKFLQGTDNVAKFMLLGLLDWMKNAPEHAGANDVLQKGLEGKDGAIRRATAMLAFEMNEFEVLESMSRADPDASVRRKAISFLQKRPN